MKELTLPLSKSAAAELRAGDSVSLTGVILTARDCAHKRIFQILEEGKPLPFDLKNAVIYYAGLALQKRGRLREVAVPLPRREWRVLRPRF